MKRLTVFLFALLASASLWAEVIETPVTLPHNLGSGVLYTNSKVKKPTAGVIVVHEWWGLNEYARGRARQLAKEGYSAIAVDMYGTGKVADHPKDAQAFMEKALAEPEKMTARFNAAKAILLQQKMVDKDRLYAIGYCFGGGVVLNQARMGNDLYGVASFHGSLGTDHPAEPGKIKARLLVATGDADPFNPPETVGAFVSEMEKAGADLQLLTFPGVKHSFTNPDATAMGKKYDLPLAYDKHADKVSWKALEKFLKASKKKAGKS